MTNDSDSIATLRLLAKCGSMDLSMLGPIADEIKELRGNLSLAEEGLANYALEVERLQKQIEILQRANRFLSEQIPSAHEPEKPL